MALEQSNITKEWELYMYLLRCAIRGEQVEESRLEPFREIDSEVIRKKAAAGGQDFLLESYIDKYVSYCTGECVQPKRDIRRAVYEYEKYKCIRNVLALAKEHNIPFILFKGCILADLYPQYIQRNSCDTDILVYPEYKEQAVDMLVAAGYVINKEHSKEEVCVLKYSKFPHTIELHTCLWEDYKGKRLDILNSFELTKRDKLIELNACGFEVTTLGYAEHLLYQIFHIIKHFSLEGVGVKYLADITLYVDAYGKYIDFEQLWSKLEKLQYAKFAHYLFAICIEFLGMDRAIIADRHMEMGDELVDFMLDLFNGGNIFDKKYDSWQILGMMTPYFTGEKKSGKGKAARKLAVIFPRSKDLQDSYQYAKKYPILLPVAWIKRMIDYLIKYRSKSDDWYNAGEKLDAAEHRIDLMDKMGLLG